ncbi:MAG TPA: hypothetical protein VJ954_04255 [Ignavibacteriaceae bacterium]|nr:hypothetical protein [Ignavibacteriaceae bacterium]
MPLFSVVVSAIGIVAVTMILLVGGSYLAYRIKKKSTYQRYY